MTMPFTAILTIQLVLLVLLVLCFTAVVAGAPPAQTLTVCAGLLDASRVTVTDMSLQHCIEVDVCTQKNHRGEAIAAASWTHRSAAPLRVTYDDLYGGLAHNNIDAVRVPRGVDVELCEPDFAELRTSGQYVCNPTTIQHVLGNCMNAEGNTCVYRAQLLFPRLQLMRYSFQTTWGCHTAAEPGFKLSMSTVPNQKLACGVIPNAQYTRQCDFVCLPAHTLVNGVCVHQCAVDVQTTCLPHEYADTICNANDGSVWFICKPCVTTAGTGIASFSTRADRSSDTCEAAPCAAGQYGVAGLCRPCVENFYTDVSGQAACVPCAWGRHHPAAGGTACVECFTSPASPGQPTSCPAGQQRYGQLQKIEDYFQHSISMSLPSLSETMMYGFCLQGFACLPCRPGQYELDGLCVPCAVGTYQPHFETSKCFTCSTGQTTVRAGSSSSDECICLSGFE